MPGFVIISGMCPSVWRKVYSLSSISPTWEERMAFYYAPRPSLAFTYLFPIQYVVPQPPEVYYQPPPQGYVYQPPPVGYVYQPPAVTYLYQPPGQLYWYQPPMVKIQ